MEYKGNRQFKHSRRDDLAMKTLQGFTLKEFLKYRLILQSMVTFRSELSTCCIYVNSVFHLYLYALTSGAYIAYRQMIA